MATYPLSQLFGSSKSSKHARTTAYATMPPHQDRYEVSLELVTIAGTEYAMQADLSHYEDVAELEDDILCFLPTVSDLDVFGCELDLLDLHTQSNPCQRHSARCSCNDRNHKLWFVPAWWTDIPSGSSRQRSRFVSVVHVKGDGCKREATLERIFSQLRPWCQDVTVLCFVTGSNSTWGAALRKHPSAVLDCRHLSQHIAPLESPFRQTYDRGWNLDNLQLLTTLPGRESYMLNAHCHFYVREQGCSMKGSVSNFHAGWPGHVQL